MDELIVEKEKKKHRRREQEEKNKEKKRSGFVAPTLSLFPNPSISLDKTLPLSQQNTKPILFDIRLLSTPKRSLSKDLLEISPKLKTTSPEIISSIKLFSKTNIKLNDTKPTINSRETKPFKIDNLILLNMPETTLNETLPTPLAGGDYVEEDPNDHIPSAEGANIDFSDRLVLILPQENNQALSPLLELAFELGRTWARIFFDKNPNVITIKDLSRDYIEAEHTDVIYLPAVDPKDEEYLEQLLIGKPKVLILVDPRDKKIIQLCQQKAFVLMIAEKFSVEPQSRGLIVFPSFIDPMKNGMDQYITSYNLFGNVVSLYKKRLSFSVHSLGVFVKPQEKEGGVVDKEQFPWKCAMAEYLIREEFGKRINPTTIKELIESGQLKFEEKIEDFIPDIVFEHAHSGKIMVEIETFFGTGLPLTKIIHDIDKFSGRESAELWIVLPIFQWNLLKPFILWAKTWLKEYVKGKNLSVKLFSLYLKEEGGVYRWKMKRELKFP